jgi:predicted transcriptional regulator
MQSNENIKKIAKNLPVGSFKEIAKRTGLVERTIVNFFNCYTTPRIDTYNKIMDETLLFLQEFRAKENEIITLLG